MGRGLPGVGRGHGERSWTVGRYTAGTKTAKTDIIEATVAPHIDYTGTGNKKPPGDGKALPRHSYLTSCLSGRLRVVSPLWDPFLPFARVFLSAVPDFIVDLVIARSGTSWNQRAKIETTFSDV